MFEDVEKRMKKSKKSDHLQAQMVSSLPKIKNALKKSPVSVAVDTRIQIETAQQELQKYIKKNPNPSAQQKEIFRNILGRVQKLTEKINQTKNKIKKKSIN